MHALKDLQEYCNVPMKASRMIGTKVFDGVGENLGILREFLVDPHTGKVAHAIVALGGFLGLGGKLFAIPFGAFKYDAVLNGFEVDIPKQQLHAAQGIDADNWPAMSEERWNRDVFEYFGRSPFWE